MKAKRALAEVCIVIALLTTVGGTGPAGQGSAQSAGQPELRSVNWDRKVIYASKDAWINEYEPLANYGQDTLLIVGRGGCNLPANHGRALLYFDLSTIPHDAEITGATLTLFMTMADHVGPLPESSIITVHSVGDLWFEHLASWRMQPTLLQAYGSTSVGSDQVPGWTRWDATAWVQAIHGGALNYGLMLVAAFGMCTERAYVSREGGFGYCPTLVVDYTLPDATPTPTPTCRLYLPVVMRQ